MERWLHLSLKYFLCTQIPFSTVIYWTLFLKTGTKIMALMFEKIIKASLFLMLALVVICIVYCWQMFIKKNATADLTTIPFIPDASLSSLKHIEEIESKKIVHSQVKPAKVSNDNPVIVKDNLVNKSVPANPQIFTSNVGNTNEEPPPEMEGTDGPRTEGAAIIDSLKSSAPVVMGQSCYFSYLQYHVGTNQADTNF